MHGLTLANAPGLIDAGYRGELICSVVNLDRDESVKIARGDPPGPLSRTFRVMQPPI
jgi:dUTPase